MYDQSKVDDLIQDIINAGRFQGASILELARASYVVVQSCESCIVKNAGLLDSKEFEEKLERVKKAIKGIEAIASPVVGGADG